MWHRQKYSFYILIVRKQLQGLDNWSHEHDFGFVFCAMINCHEWSSESKSVEITVLQVFP